MAYVWDDNEIKGMNNGFLFIGPIPPVTTTGGKMVIE
jgi:hypothetical protein